MCHSLHVVGEVPPWPSLGEVPLYPPLKVDKRFFLFSFFYSSFTVISCLLRWHLVYVSKEVKSVKAQLPSKPGDGQPTPSAGSFPTAAGSPQQGFLRLAWQRLCQGLKYRWGVSGWCAISGSSHYDSESEHSPWHWIIHARKVSA